MCRNVRNNCRERTDTKWAVIWNGNVMRLRLIAGKTDVAAGLAGNTISQAGKLLDQLCARNVTR